MMIERAFWPEDVELSEPKRDCAVFVVEPVVELLKLESESVDGEEW